MSIGFENAFFNNLLILIILLYIIAMIPIIRRSFKEKHIYRWNNLSLLFITITVCIFIAIPFRDGYFLINYPWNFFLYVFTGGYLLACIIVSKIPAKEKKKKESSGLRQEFKRKTIHLASSLYFLAFLFGPLIMIGITYIKSPLIMTDEYYTTIYNLAYIQDPMRFGLSFFIFLMLGSFIVQMTTELLRLNWPKVNFPLRTTLITVQRRDESQSFAVHPHMTLTWGLCAILLLYFSPNVNTAAYTIFGVVMVAIFGDMYAALIGRKFGKHKWLFLPDKSIEGTLAGFIVSIIVGMVFMGFWISLIGGCIFIITDIFIPKIIQISDNLLTPLLFTLILLFIVQIPNIVQPLFKIRFIGIFSYEPYTIVYTPKAGFYGTFPCVIIICLIPPFLGLILFWKYRKNEIIYLFTGKKKE
ncbi:MAG: phosphatidate cytidylyltransferase [Promethearchaeota archaeon]